MRSNPDVLTRTLLTLPAVVFALVCCIGLEGASAADLLAGAQTNDQSSYSSPTQLSGYQETTQALSQTSGGAALSAGRKLYVSTSGSDSASGGEGSAWRTLKYAVSKLQAGDTLYVMEGVYSEKVQFTTSGTLDNYITIEGVGNVVFDKSKIGTYDAVFDTNARSYISFRNLSFKNVRAGVQVTGGSNIKIDGLKVEDSHFAVKMSSASYVTVINTKAYRSRNAFRGEGTTHHVLFENVEAYESKDVYDGMDLNYLNGDGFIFESDTHDLTFRNIKSADHWDAGMDIKGDNVRIENVEVWGSKNGLKLWGDNILVTGALVRNAKAQVRSDGVKVEGMGTNVRRGTTTFVNCTFVDNEVENVKVADNATVHLENSIVANKTNTGKLLGKYGVFTQKNVLWYKGGISRPSSFDLPPGSLWADPGFTNWNAGDYRLAESSAAVDAGTSRTPETAKDLGGLDRLSGTRLDLGAYERAARPLSITGLVDGAIVSGKIFVGLVTQPGLSIRKAHFYLNGTQSGRLYSGPFVWGGEAGKDTTTLKNGVYRLSGYADTYQGQQLKFSVTFEVKN